MMDDGECGICGGKKVIQLRDRGISRPVPYYTDISEALSAPAVQVTMREFPCPGCAKLPPHRIALVEETVEITMSTIQQAHVDVIGAEKRTLVRMLAEKLMESDLVSFTYEETFKGSLAIKLSAAIGVATPPDLAALINLIERHREPVAMQVAAEIMDEVNNWGSNHGELMISKAKVAECARHALRQVLERTRRPA